jgi:hypothetical protein
MPKALLLALFFLGGLIVTFVAVVAGLIWHMQLNGIPDREGAMTMGILFVIGPIAALHGGVIAALVLPLWLRRRNRWPPAQRTAGAAGAPRWPAGKRAAFAAVVTGVAVCTLISAAIRLPGFTFSTYQAALLASVSPYAFGLAAAGIAALLVLRKAQRPGV